MGGLKHVPKPTWTRIDEGWPTGAWGGKCNVYVVQEESDGPFKVGIAGHPIRRLSTLQCGNYRRLHLIAVYAGTPSVCADTEKRCLRFFGAPKGSEWFYADRDRLMSFLDAYVDE